LIFGFCEVEKADGVEAEIDRDIDNINSIDDIGY
jgi:hypothetical protein